MPLDLDYRPTGLISAQLILLFGNFMNANGNKGGAFGFRVGSINRVRFTWHYHTCRL
jgi:hypothetical protein